jgi:hypothetical protein
MAIVSTGANAGEAAISEIGGSDEGPLRLRIHDSSRFEWSVSLPLPDGRKTDYRIEASLEIPSSAGSRYAPWDQLRTATRLDGPAGVANPQDLDALRRGAVTLTQMLARARDGFARHCRTAATEPETAAALGGEKSFLLVWLEAALRAVQEARDKLTHGLEGEAQTIARERVLVDEYVSVRLLDMLADAQRTLKQTGQGPVRDAIQERIDEALRGELDYRSRKIFLRPALDAPDQLDAYLGRAARLKKHLEEVLFLDRETNQLDERVQQWLGALGAWAPKEAARRSASSTSPCPTPRRIADGSTKRSSSSPVPFVFGSMVTNPLGYPGRSFDGDDAYVVAETLS